VERNVQRIQLESLKDDEVMRLAAALIGEKGRLPIPMQIELAVRLCRHVSSEGESNHFEGVARMRMLHKPKQLSFKF
tara:strand:+ start:56 stop:286 length:231 start_codon:yes stop_codon:yes gene_type:complete